jgi:hypothetical protein
MTSDLEPVYREVIGSALEHKSNSQPESTVPQHNTSVFEIAYSSAPITPDSRSTEITSHSSWRDGVQSADQIKARPIPPRRLDSHIQKSLLNDGS